jgi:hypothetical protein
MCVGWNILVRQSNLSGVTVVTHDAMESARERKF